MSENFPAFNERALNTIENNFKNLPVPDFRALDYGAMQVIKRYDKFWYKALLTAPYTNNDQLLSFLTFEISPHKTISYNIDKSDYDYSFSPDRIKCDNCISYQSDFYGYLHDLVYYLDFKFTRGERVDYGDLIRILGFDSIDEIIDYIMSYLNDRIMQYADHIQTAHNNDCRGCTHE